MEFDRFFFEKQYAIYEGEYTVNIFGKIRPNGFGIYRDALGRNYEGEWKDGLIYGKGTYTYFTIKFVIYESLYKNYYYCPHKGIYMSTPICHLFSFG